MKDYKVELRATPDTDAIEIQSIKNGGPTSPQTVYYTVAANSYEEACERAIKAELACRKSRTITVEVRGKILHVPLVADVWVFGTRKPISCCGNGSGSCEMKPILNPYQEYDDFVSGLAKHLDSVEYRN